MPPDAVPADEPTDEEQLEELPEDTRDTPFRPADNATYQDNQQQGHVEPLEPADRNDPVVTEDRQTVQPNVGGIDDTHPETDTNLERSEYYDEGISGAAEAGEPNANDAVGGYRDSEDAAPPPADYIPEGFHETGEDEER